MQQDAYRLPRIHANVTTPAGALQVVALHTLPPTDPRNLSIRDEQIAEVRDGLGPNATHTIVLGDLNATPWTASVLDLGAQTGLVDARRGRGLLSTWPSWLGRFGIAIDQLLHSPDLEVTRVRVGPDIGSDHLPLITDIIVRD